MESQENICPRPDQVNLHKSHSSRNHNFYIWRKNPCIKTIKVRRSVCTWLKIMKKKKNLHRSLVRVFLHTSYMNIHRWRAHNLDLTRNGTATTAWHHPTASRDHYSLLKQNLNLGIQGPCINKKQFNSSTVHWVGKSMTLVFQAVLDIIGSQNDLSFLSFLITLQGKCAYD